MKFGLKQKHQSTTKPFVVSPAATLRRALSNHEQPFDRLRANGFVTNKKSSLNKSAGFTLLPVILTMSLIAAIAFLLNRDNGVNAEMVASQSDSDRARYAAEAGLQAVNASIQGNNCTGSYPSIINPKSNSNFGGASYSSYAVVPSGNSTSLVSTGSYNGTSVTLTRSNVLAYQTTPNTYTLQPAAGAGQDTFIRTGAPTSNFGNIVDLEIKPPNGIDYSLLKFDLAAFPAGSLPLSALLYLYPSNISGSGTNSVYLYRLVNSWTEGDGSSGSGATWNTRDGTLSWSTAGGDRHPVSVAVSNATQGVWSSFDVTDLTTSWLLGRYANNGMLLDLPLLSNNMKFSSSDHSNAANRPKITFNYLLPCGTTGPTDTPCTPGNVRDDFTTISYAGNNGSTNWTNSWTETGESDGPTTGKLSVITNATCASGNCMKLRNDTSTVVRLTREANLAAAITASLKFSYRRTMVSGSGGNIQLEISKDGGSTFTLLKTYPLNVTDSAQISENIDISAYIAANTQIRFSTDGSNIQTNIHIDNIEIVSGCAPAGSLSTVTLSPVADTYLAGGSNTNFGTAVALKSGRNNGGPMLYPLLKFDVSSIPAGALLTSAKLRLYQYTSANSGTFDLGVYRVNQAWTETGANWNTANGTTAWTGGGGGTFSLPVISSNTVTIGNYSWHEWEIKPLVQEWVDSVSPNHGMELLAISANAGSNVSFASKEHTTATWRPQLVVNYTAP